jgi:toxin YoeB
VTWQLVYSKQTQIDAQKLASSGLKDKTKELLKIAENNPFQTPPPYEKLVGDLAGAYSRRLNIQCRFVYQVLEKGTSGEGATSMDTLRIEVAAN